MATDFLGQLSQSPLFKPPLIYFLLIAVIGVIIIIIWWKFRKKPKEEHFKGETIEEVIQSQNFARYFDAFGRKGRKAWLYWNFGSMKIGRVVKFNTILDIPEKKQYIDKKTKEVKTEVLTKATPFDFICFQQKKFLMRIPILRRLSHPDYVVIDDDKEHIKKDAYGDEWIISSNIHLHLFGGVWIGTIGSTSLLTEMIYKRTYEHEKEIEMNTPKRFVWYNDLYASKMTSKLLEAEIEDDKYKKRISRETGT